MGIFCVSAGRFRLHALLSAGGRGKRLFLRIGKETAVGVGIFVTDFGAVRNGVFRAVFFCLFYNNFTLF